MRVSPAAPTIRSPATTLLRCWRCAVNANEQSTRSATLLKNSRRSPRRERSVIRTWHFFATTLRSRSFSTLMLDVLIVGGGPAGLSAALMLGRCRRQVLVCDSGHPRNEASHAMHGFLTRDGMPPADFLELAREELKTYGTVTVRSVTVTSAECKEGAFVTTLETGEQLRSRKLLIATGVRDNVPELEGIKELYGRSVFHCPYCDGWEIRDQPIAIYGQGERGYGLALELTAWSRDLVLCTDGPSGLERRKVKRLQRNGIAVR